MADTGAAATAASSAPAESSLVALTGAGSPWGTVRLRPARCLPSRRPFCHLLASGALWTSRCAVPCGSLWELCARLAAEQSTPRVDSESCVA